MTTMLDTLFGLIPAVSTGQQWLARDLQLVNWGGYDGHHQVRLAPTATLLSGGSGSGKSTLMDAYIALLMPHTTPFNGASNGGVVGRPRGRDQRNVISYARGKLDESRTDDGTRHRVLRGHGQDTWSAIAMTWADQTGTMVTAVRAWYVPDAARAMDDLVTVRATCDGQFDLRDLQDAAAHRLGRAAVTAAGLTCFDTDRDFTARLHSTLGIGAAGGGSKAVALLGRIQAGQQITTVDALYKAMVLEEPDTLAKADEVVEHFDQLADTRARMLTAQQQVRVLAPVRQHRTDVDAARGRLAVIDTLGSCDRRPAVPSPAALWRHSRRLDLLRAVEDDQRARHRDARSQVVELGAQVAATKIQLEAAQQTLWASGGDRLAQARRELDHAHTVRDQVAQARDALDAAAAVLGVEVTSRADFDSLHGTVRQRLADSGSRSSVLEVLLAARQQFGDIEHEVKDLESERADLARRTDNVPRDLHTARAALAGAAGLEPTDLPFVAELVEVRTEHEPWRAAFNLAMGGFATTVLIDAARLAAFRKAIDQVKTDRRIRYEAVPTGLRCDVRPDTRTLPGRLDYRPSPFTGWLASRMADRFGYVCVDTPGELSQHDMALTRSGQVSRAATGAHGGRGANVLGFTNTRRLAELDEQIAAAHARRAEVRAALGHAEEAFDTFDDQRAACLAVRDTTWDDVDVDGADATLERWAQIVEQVTSDSPEVTRLGQQVTALDSQRDTLTGALGQAERLVADLHTAWEATTDAVDAAQQALDETAEAGLDDAQRGYLDTLFTGAGPTGPEPDDDAGAASPEEALAAFDLAVRHVDDRLRADRDVAALAVETGLAALRTAFETFCDRWSDPNLGTDPDESYADFDRILTDLTTHGLHELETEWRKSLLRLSGNDLTDLDNALSRARRQISERIDPVNEILAGLPFADDDHRLRIDARPVASTEVSRFRRELRDVREMLDREATDEQRAERYARTAKVVDRVRRGSPDFVDLVDVRRHVRISAEKVDLDGTHVALYDHIGEKSGGESQELVAFIVGAALRYQLGDPGAERPRYAPVFLDEALIKADARFTGRAVGAWRGLGFQLVIAAPDDKVTALEPHVDAQYRMLKDATGRSRAKPVVRVVAETA